LPLAILAADTVSRFLVGSGFSRILAVSLVSLVALGSAWIQRAAYKELRAAKMTYARLVDFVGREVRPEGYAVTDLWWLDQVAGSLTDSRHILYAADLGSAADALQRLDARAERNVVLIRSRVESPGSFQPWIAKTCYAPGRESAIPERTLYVVPLARSCG
jgi:hypothetical protein